MAVSLDPIFFVGLFGACAVSFLWLRDTRIFVRTGLPGYRKAAYQGVLITALAWFGCALCGMLDVTLLYLGIGLILLSLYLQSRIKKEDVWVGNEPALKRFIGSAPQRRNK